MVLFNQHSIYFLNFISIINLFIVKCKKNIKFVQGRDFDLIENLPNNETKYLLLLDDSCEKISNSKQFFKSCHGWKAHGSEQNIHQTQFVSSKQIGKRCRITKYTHSLVQVFGRCFTNQYIKSTIRSRSQLKEWYQDAISVPYSHLLIDLTPKTVDSLRFCSSSGSVLTNSYLTARTETKFLDDEYTIRLYSPNISTIFPKTSKTIHFQLSKRLFSFSESV